MSKPVVSSHFAVKMPSPIRMAQLKFEERENKPDACVNVSIGNVSLPTNPAMQKRMFALDAPESPFANGVVMYTTTAGTGECQDAFKNILACEGFETDKLFVQVTDGGSAAMEMIILGLCGPAGSGEKPLMMIDPAYTNYISFAERTGRSTVTIDRTLGDDGTFTLPQLDVIEQAIIDHDPGALLVIPYDNPTGQLYDYETMKQLAKLCVKYNLWMISDEAYRELYYSPDAELVSIWGITDKDVPGIEGRRLSVETASKVWSACGLRIGAVISDDAEFFARSVAEYTANLCPNAIGQYIFGALAHQSKEEIADWCAKLREYYKDLVLTVYNGFRELEPDLIVSSPDASIYSVLDVRKLIKPNFDAIDFILYCASKGSVNIDGVDTTLLVAPMAGFYDNISEGDIKGATQFRIAFVESPENMAKVPELFVKLLRQYEAQR